MEVVKLGLTLEYISLVNATNQCNIVKCAYSQQRKQQLL